MSYTFRKLDMMVPVQGVLPTDTVLEARKKFCARIKTSTVEGTRLKFKGRLLDDNKTLEE